jgi:hypothetical protein
LGSLESQADGNHPLHLIGVAIVSNERWEGQGG